MTEMCEHIVVIDENMKVVMMIPKEFNAMQFKAMMMKANLLFKSSEPMISEPVRQIHRRTGRHASVFTPEVTEFCVAEIKKGLKSQEIVDNVNSKFHINLTKPQLWNQKWDWKQKGLLS